MLQRVVSQSYLECKLLANLRYGDFRSNSGDLATNVFMTLSIIFRSSVLWTTTLDSKAYEMSEALSDVAVVDRGGQIDFCPNLTKTDQSANLMP